MLDHLPVVPVSRSALEEAQKIIDLKTKPRGSLGFLEKLACRMSAIQDSLAPQAEPARLLLFAADHGLVTEGVSAWPSEVTTQMVLNFLNDGAAANVFARTNKVDVSIIDAGIANDVSYHPDLIQANIKKGTDNTMDGDAMNPDELRQALEFGAKLAIDAAKEGIKVILIGEMGIGNTSAASLLTHAMLDIEISHLVGPGAGLDENGVKHKAKVLEKVAARKPGRLSPFDALQAFGGLEIAMMTGAVIGAASSEVTILIDGFISSTSAMCALAARPQVMDYMIFSHLSKEPGHQLMLGELGVNPLLDLDLRLGEGTGALLAYPLLRNACNMMREMATFETAKVSGKNTWTGICIPNG